MVKDQIAIIPARGGSKRLPKKNIMDFQGKPMIAWTVEAALRSNRFERVLVSTDDHEIADVAIEYGAEVPFLRAAATDDHAPVSAATLGALKQAENHWKKRFDLVVQLMPNCPLRNADNIDSALRSYFFYRPEINFQISCFQFGWMNPWWAAQLDSSGKPVRLFPEAIAKRSQDLPDLFCPTGAIWVASADALRDAQTFYGPGHRFEPMPWENGVDIDDEDDLKFAQALVYLKSGGSA